MWARFSSRRPVVAYSNFKPNVTTGRDHEHHLLYPSRKIPASISIHVDQITRHHRSKSMAVGPTSLFRRYSTRSADFLEALEVFLAASIVACLPVILLFLLTVQQRLAPHQQSEWRFSPPLFHLNIQAFPPLAQHD